MIQFGIFVALFIAIALCFLLIPLWLKPKIVSNNDAEINIELAQKKLQSLEIDLENGVISQAQYEPLKNELLLNLHRDLKRAESPVFDEKKGRWLAIPLSVFVPLLALAIYSVKGDFRAFDENVAQAQMKEKPTAADINAMVEKLAQKMKENPSDAEGWVMLGRSYKVLKRYPEAVDSLRKARALTGDTIELLLQLADVVAMQNSGSLRGEPAELITKSLEIDANNDMALWLSGLVNAEEGRFNEALTFWKKLQTHYQAQDPDYLEVQKMIDQAQEALGQVKSVDNKITTSSKSIRLAISLDEKFKSTVNPDDIVFIYAQPAQGGKMPLAAVKKQVKDLPLDITLDDSMAMMPTMTISSIENVQISARISHSGNAIAQSGEPIGKIQISTSADNGVLKLVISEFVP